MEQSEKSEQRTATDVMVDKIAKSQFFQQPEMIRFLLIENLALKTLLHEKGSLTPEDHKAHVAKAEAMLDRKTNAFVEQWKKDHPEIISKLEDSGCQDNTHPVKECCGGGKCKEAVA